MVLERCREERDAEVKFQGYLIQVCVKVEWKVIGEKAKRAVYRPVYMISLFYI